MLLCRRAGRSNQILEPAQGPPIHLVLTNQFYHLIRKRRGPTSILDCVNYYKQPVLHNLRFVVSEILIPNVARPGTSQNKGHGTSVVDSSRLWLVDRCRGNACCKSGCVKSAQTFGLGRLNSFPEAINAASITADTSAPNGLLPLHPPVLCAAWRTRLLRLAPLLS